MKIVWPRKEDIHISNADDPVEFYYKFLTGHFFKKRLELALRLMGCNYYTRLLEVGFGSGIFLPELSRHCTELYGTDIHQNTSLVLEMLEKYGIASRLFSQSVMSMDFPDNFFDCIICMSVLEHFTVPELKKSVSEIFRVSRENADIIVGFPVNGIPSQVYSRFVRFNWKCHHLSSQKKILPVLKSFFKVEKILHWPLFVPTGLSFYMCLKCKKREQK